MSHPPTKHSFDTMFVILCVIAGASSHSLSNSSRNLPTHLLNHRYRYSIIDLILDASITQLPHKPQAKSSATSNRGMPDDKQQSQLLDELPSNDNNLKQSYNVCTLLSNVLGGSQLEFCTKHQEMLQQVLPHIMDLAIAECVKITGDLRWNCTSIELFLDRSNSLAFTKEAALIRSLVNASMMYLIVKTCTNQSHYSCSCASTRGLFNPASSILKPTNTVASIKPEMSNLIMDQIILDHSQVDDLRTGSPLRLSRPMVKHRGCDENSALADHLTRILFDADDLKSLNKASRILNGNFDKTKGKKRRNQDMDQRDLSFIKWTKSAVSLHNNNVGRQIVRAATRKQCRCHGLSGVCQFQTCWDQLASFSEIAASLRTIYLSSTYSVGYRNLGSVERPDIYLAKLGSSDIQPQSYSDTTHPDDPHFLDDRIKANELAYFYESPDYCEDQPLIKHRGTKGRQCVVEHGSTINEMNGTRVKLPSTGFDQAPPITLNFLGTCEYLCCGRGHHSELELYVVKCECRFTFCCKVECTNCPHQRLLHYCL